MRPSGWLARAYAYPHDGVELLVRTSVYSSATAVQSGKSTYYCGSTECHDQTVHKRRFQYGESMMTECNQILLLHLTACNRPVQYLHPADQVHSRNMPITRHLRGGRHIRTTMPVLQALLVQFTSWVLARAQYLNLVTPVSHASVSFLANELD